MCVQRERPPKLNERAQRTHDCDSGREESVLPTTFIHFVALIHSYVRALYLSFIARLSRQNKTNNNNNKTRKKTRSFSFILTARVEEKKFSASAAAAWSPRGVEMQLMNGGNSSNNYNFDLGLRDGNGNCDCGCLAVCLPTRGTLSCFCYFFVSLLCSSSAAATVASLSSLSCCHCCCCCSSDGWCLFPSFLRVLHCPPSKVPVNRLGPRLRCCCCCANCDVGAASLAQLWLRDCAASCSVCLALATVFILILAAAVVVFSFYLFIIWSQTPLTHICGQLLQTSCCAATAGREGEG